MPTTTTCDLTTLQFVRDWLDKLLETISDDQMLHQPVPGGNHALWTIGHLAWCDDTFRANLSGAEPRTPPAWKGLFGDKTAPVGDASHYPGVDEVKQALTECREDLVAWFEGMDDAKLGESLPDDWKGFAPTYASLVNTIAAHEAAHVGQLTVVRKSLGMAPALG